MGSPTTIMGGSRLIIAAIGLAMTPLLTRVLSPDEYGSYALAIVIAAFSATVPTQWLASATLRYAPSMDRHRLSRLTRRGMLLSAPVVVAFSLLGSIATFTPVWSVIFATVLYAVTEAAFTVLWMRTRATLQMWRFATSGVLRNAIPLGSIAALAATGLPIGVALVLSFMTVSNLVACAVITLRRLPLGRGASPDESGLAKWFAYGWPLVLNYALGLVLAYVDRFMILGILGSTAVGRFAPTYDLMFSIITLTTALVGLTAVPKLFGTRDRDSQAVQLRRLHVRVVAVSITIGLLMVVGWPQLSRLLIGPSVRVTDWVFIGTLGLSFIIMAYRFQYVNIVIQLNERTKLQTYATLAAVVTNIAANFILIPTAGLNGAAFSTLIASVVAAAFVPIWNVATSSKGS